MAYLKTQSNVFLIFPTTFYLDPFSPEDIISYYPNPVREELYLKWDLSNENKVSSIEVYSINGQRVNEYHNLDKENTKNIPFQEYSQGTYLVHLNYTNGEQKSITILKQ